MNGPLRMDPKGYIPLMPFSLPLGIEFPVFTTISTWEDVLRHDPGGAMRSLNTAIGRALAGKGADQSSITFKHWIPRQGEQRKAHRVRLSASLYQMQESDQPWILLRPASARSQRGLSLAS